MDIFKLHERPETIMNKGNKIKLEQVFAAPNKIIMTA